MPEKLIKRIDYVAHRHLRMQTRAYKLFQATQRIPFKDLAEDHPHAQALMRVWMEFSDNVVGIFGPLALEEATKPEPEAAK